MLRNAEVAVGADRSVSTLNVSGESEQSNKEKEEEEDLSTPDVLRGAWSIVFAGVEGLSPLTLERAGAGKDGLIPEDRVEKKNSAGEEEDLEEVEILATAALLALLLPPMMVVVVVVVDLVGGVGAVRHIVAVASCKGSP